MWNDISLASSIVPLIALFVFNLTTPNVMIGKTFCQEATEVGGPL
jgi:hypothetical protein